MSRRESPTPSPSPPPSSHFAAAHHRPSALDALQHLAPPAADGQALTDSPYRSPLGASSPAAAGLQAAPAAQLGSQHAAFPAAASPSMPPRFAEKQLPPEFLAGPSGYNDEPSPSPPAHTGLARHDHGDAGFARQQPLPAQADAARTFEQGAAAAFAGGPIAVNEVAALPADQHGSAARSVELDSQQQPNDNVLNRPPPVGTASDAALQLQEQQPDYDIAPEHQFRIVSSDDESSDSDNSNSGTGY